jgi:Dockerin type I domain
MPSDKQFGKDISPNRTRKSLRRQLLQPQFEALEERTLLATFAVLNQADLGEGSLRQAILDANATPGLDTIVFNISGPGVKIIQPASPLPVIAESVLLDATTQAGYVGTPLIELDGSNILNIQNGIAFATNSSLLVGMSIINWRGAGILITGSNNRVESSFIGLRSDGLTEAGNGIGVQLANGATSNMIGGFTATSRNVISGNLVYGIEVSGSNTFENVISGNFIGTDVNGSTAVGNAGSGVSITAGASRNVIGGSTPTSRNIISGNRQGVILNDNGLGNVVQGNFIGTNSDGTFAVPNSDTGVIIGSGQFLIGGSTIGAGNLISGNAAYGVAVLGGSQTIQGNTIGLQTDGISPLPNNTGVYIAFSSGNEIGGTAVGAGNVISGNTSRGVHLRGGSSNQVLGNRIGTDATGRLDHGNAIGVLITEGETGSTIGGDSVAARNIISGNDQYGVLIQDVGTTNIRIIGNYIGVDSTGELPVDNRNGVGIRNGAAGNFVGGGAIGAGNVISGHNFNGIVGGVSILDIGTSNNRVQGNLIGLNQSGDASIANRIGILMSLATSNYIGTDGDGVNDEREGNVISGNNLGFYILNEADNNVIAGNKIGTNSAGNRAVGNSTGIQILDVNVNGTRVGTNSDGVSDEWEGNLISGNNGPGGAGVDDRGSGSVYAGNFVGTDISGTVSIPNRYGIQLAATATGTRIGTNADGVHDDRERNVISGNQLSGVIVSGVTAIGNSIGGNFIGTDKSGLIAVPNLQHGISIDGSASGNTIGGTSLASHNILSGNSQAGILITNSAVDNVVQGNYIGVDITGERAIGNGRSGVLINNSAANNVIGGTSFAARNIISGNTLSGVEVTSAGTNNNIIAGNIIGLSNAGNTVVGNGLNGVSLLGGAGTIVGGFAMNPGTAPGNVISGNASTGVFVNGSTSEFIRGNIIGLDASGSIGLGNNTGVAMANGSPHIIGGDDDDDGRLDGIVMSRNVISGNSSNGITLAGGPSDVTIQGNYIGTNRDGTSAVANRVGGLNLGSSYNVQVGGTSTGAGNLISGNLGVGIGTFQGNFFDQRVTIEGNLIGVDSSGTRPIPNTGGGIATNNFLPNSVTIGGSAIASRNVISGNSGYGIRVVGSAVLVAGNLIGTDISGTQDLGNESVGLIVAGSSDNVIQGNTISGNNSGGVRLESGSTGNIFTLNKIGTSTTGNVAVANGTQSLAAFGVEIIGASNNTIGQAGAANTISGNLGDGIILRSGATANSIRGNLIGTSSPGLGELGNTGHAIRFLDATTNNNTVGGPTINDGNLLYYNVGSALRLEGLTSTTVSGNSFENNAFLGNLGLAIDTGTAGPSLNDGLDEASDLRDFPVLVDVGIDPTLSELIVRGLSQPDKRIELFTSSPSPNGRGQGLDRLLSFVEGSGLDLDSSTGSYGAPWAATTVLANRFEVRLPIPDGVNYGTLITALSIGSISEFSNTVPAGLATADMANNLAPIVTLPPTLSLITGQALKVEGSYLDDDSTDWIATVDYGDGSGRQTLVLDKQNRRFSLDHVYSSSATSPFTVTVRVTDNGGKVSSATMLITVQNEAPTLTFNRFTVTSVVDEGGLVTLKGLFSDTGATDSHLVTIDWGDGNVVRSNSGSPDIAPIPIGARTFTATHRYVDDGVSNTPRDSYRIIVTVTDDSLQSDISPVGLLLIEVVNVAPSNLVANLPTVVAENAPFDLTGSFTDFGLKDEHRVHVDWGDGSTSDQLLPKVDGQTAIRTFSLNHRYRNNPEPSQTNYLIRIEVSDDDQPLKPTVLVKPIVVTNVEPVISNISLSQTLIDEGGSITLSSSYTDPGSHDEHQVSIVWGDGSEPSNLSLAAGVTNFSGIVHRYLDEPSGQFESYTITVRVRDEDMPPGIYTSSTTTIAVRNLAPSFASPFSITSGGVPVSGTVIEGDTVVLTGAYRDPGLKDIPAISITWGDGTTSLAYVDSTSRTFKTKHQFVDDSSLTGNRIQVTMDDGDGGVVSTQVPLAVTNAPPHVVLRPVENSNSSVFSLLADASDLGSADIASLSYEWTIATVGTGNSPVILNGYSNPYFVFSRNGNFLDAYRITVKVTDDEGAMVSQTTHAILLDDNANFYAPPAILQPSGVDTVTIFGMGGEDTLDLRAWSIPVALDGGTGNDVLFGGTANDILILHQGNDRAAGGLGGDRYLMTFNSTLTVDDEQGENILDFSPTEFGLTFDLSLAMNSASDLQDVAPQTPGLHFADIDGQFVEIIGTVYADRLTGASGAKIVGGDGSDHLFAPAGNSSRLDFIGGNDTDVLTIPIDSIVNQIDFEGDDGADVFVVEGSVGSIDFEGGADKDLLVISIDSVVNQIDFEGDSGADELFIHGTLTGTIDFAGGADKDLLMLAVDSVANNIDFEGDAGADELYLYGDLTGSIDFGGGADDDLLLIDWVIAGKVLFRGGADKDLLTLTVDSVATSIDFEGDDGADEFYLLGDVRGNINFEGGADKDLLIIGLDASIGMIDFEGDSGADEIYVEGVADSIHFVGGDDSDLFTMTVDSIASMIDFEGDAGADELYLNGAITGRIDFEGGGDKDLLTIGPDASLGTIDFEGDGGADEFYIFAKLNDGIRFGGGGDNDILFLAQQSTVREITFEGDAGADKLYAHGNGAGTIAFVGGEDNDTAVLGRDSSVFEVHYEGDAGADELYVYGEGTGVIDFSGGADDDQWVLGDEATVFNVRFKGDAGADDFYIYGASTGAIDFEGGADDDSLHVAPQAELKRLYFNGHLGADEFYAYGKASGLIEFRGGDDKDVLVIGPEASLIEISFEGDFGDDRFYSQASDVGRIGFSGNAGADVFVAEGSSLGNMSFSGGADDDVMIVEATAANSIDFDGGAGNDFLSTSGTDFVTIEFQGDNAIDNGNDTFINHAAGSFQLSTPSTIHFSGMGGIDAFRNDGSNWSSVTFVGGEDNDVFQNNAGELELISFQGDAGNDVFENNGAAVSGIVFVAGTGRNVLANDGDTVSGVTFFGGPDSDWLINTGSHSTDINFEGDSGNDVLFNTANFANNLNFEGADGNDQFINAGIGFTNGNFWGGAGDDRFVNQSMGTNSARLTMFSGSRFSGSTQVLNLPYGPTAPSIIIPADVVTAADDGNDAFINTGGLVTSIHFEGGDAQDTLLNNGFGVSGIQFFGGDGDDVALNTGHRLALFSMIGGSGNDSMENRGNESSDLFMDGGDGDDRLLQLGANIDQRTKGYAVELSGGQGVDVLANYGLSVTSLRLEGGSGNDRFLNVADNVQSLSFIGADGNDALQNSGSQVPTIAMDGGAGADSLLNSGSRIGRIEFSGGQGADSLIQSGNSIGESLPSSASLNGVRFLGGEDADLLRVSGNGIADVYFDAGLGDDSLLYNAQGGSLKFLAGLGNDILVYRGSAHSVSFSGDGGDDRIVYSGIAPNVPSSSPSVILSGGSGDDRYEFADTPQGYVLLTETYAGQLDTSRDTLDFSAFRGGGVRVDLASTDRQVQPNNLTIQISDPMGVETLLGSEGSDTLLGNDRNNYLGGAQFYSATSTGSSFGTSATFSYNRLAQWVYLDFDSYTEASLGEHVYTNAERIAIQQRIETAYYGWNATNNTPNSEGNRWFNIRFTQHLSDLIAANINEFVAIYFNRSQENGRPGGEASEIDFGNLNYGGLASVQVNGLLGGLEVATPFNENFMEQLPEDGQQNAGASKPAATSANFVALSAKIAAHELAHLLGLRHYDAFGPIGFGIHSPPGIVEFKPEYQGPSGAFETVDHLIGSPASIGSSRFNDVGQLFFGEREAVKIAIAMSDPALVEIDEENADHSQLSQPQALKLANVSVPNTLAKGLNSEKDFRVKAARVSGSIQLDRTGISQSDYYSFAADAGDIVTIEVASQALRRYRQSGAMGWIDSVVRLYNNTGQLVQQFGRDAVNDDEFESSDSLLMDVTLPTRGVFILEVDTFLRQSSDSSYLDLLETIANLESLLDPTDDQLDLLKRLRDSRDDSDTGKYELFLYIFNKANDFDQVDILAGRGGVDVIDEGGQVDYSLRLETLPNNATALQGVRFAQRISFEDPGGAAWHASIDYGDRTIDSQSNSTPQTGIELSHVFLEVGTYQVTVRLTNDDQMTVSGQFSAVVNANTPPVLTTVRYFGAQFNARTKVYSFYGTVTNVSNAPISGPVHLGWSNIVPTTATAFGNTGTWSDGSPYFDLSSFLGSDGVLQPGEESKPRTFSLKVVAPSAYSFTTRVRGNLIPTGAGGEGDASVGSSSLSVEPLETKAANESRSWPKHNPWAAMDVNNDGLVTPLDALLLISNLTAQGSRTVISEPYAEPYYDTSGDNVVSPLDVLTVVDYLNRNHDRSTDVGKTSALQFQAVPMIDRRADDYFASLTGETENNKLVVDLAFSDDGWQGLRRKATKHATE